jgi:hypothetical protein
MPRFDQLIDSIRDDGDLAPLAQASSLRADGHRRTVVARSAGAVAALVIVAGLTAAITVTGSRSVNVPTATAPATPVATVSAAIPRFALETGIVTVNGKPVAGAQIEIEIQPKGSVMSALKVGQAVPTEQVGPVTSGIDGRYSISIEPGDIASKFRTGSVDQVNFEIDVTLAGKYYMWNVPAQRCVGSASTKRYWCGDDGQGAPPTLDFELGTTPRVRDNTMNHTWQPLPVA